METNDDMINVLIGIAVRLRIDEKGQSDVSMVTPKSGFKLC